MKSLFTFLLLTPAIFFIPSRLDAQWVRQYPMEKLEQVLDIAIGSDGFGFAAGGDDMILRLDPNDKTWGLLNTEDLNWTLKAVDYLDGTSGMVAAAGGDGLLVTFNSGQSWIQVPGAPAGIHGIKILSMTEVLVAGAGGVFKFENNSWTDLGLPVTANVIGSQIMDDQHIWCFTGGTDPMIYFTSNGGGMWNMNDQIDRPDVLKFYDAQNGVCLDNRKVFTSVNGGQSWTEISNNAIHNTVNDITFGPSGNILMAGTLNGDPAYSVDGGLTWDQLDLNLNIHRNHSVAYGPGDAYWMGNDLSSMALSVDTGASWIETSGPAREIIYDVHFINRTIGYAVGTAGTLLRTVNGGAQWEELTFDPARTFWSVGGLTPDDVWLGTNQKIFHSADGGTTWQEKGVFLGSNFVDILPINTNEVLTCTTNGLILRTDDAGTTWDTVYQTNNQIRSLSCLATTDFMATGYNGLILRSNDSGMTWTPLTPPQAGLQYEQSYFLGDEGWLISSSFGRTMWHTTNAGDTWDPIDLPIERFWDGVFFMSPDTGIVVGRSTAEGRTYITFNGGQNWQAGYITPFSMHGTSGIPSPNGIAWIFGYGSNIEVLPYCDLLPVITDLTGNNAPCQNDTVAYTITAQDVDNFFWLFPAGWQVIGNADNDTVLVKVGQNSGTVSVTGSNACGFSSPVNMQVGPVLLPALGGIGGNDGPCEGELTGYAVSGNNIVDYTWSLPGTDWEIIGNENADAIQVVVGATQGTMTVTGSNVCGQSQSSLVITPSPLPKTLSVTGELTPCENEIITYTANVEFATTVSWTYPSDWQVSGPSDQVTIDLIAGVESGLVTATGVNGCGPGGSQELNATPIDVPDVTVIVNDNNLSLSQDAATYQWYFNGSPVSGGTMATYTATVSGDYYAIVIFPDGCEATSNTVSVMVSSTGDQTRLARISVFPSPATDVLYIRGLEGVFRYDILDQGGKSLLKGESTTGQLDVSMLASGAYRIRIQVNQEVRLLSFGVLR